jgi:hypothetical protein
MDGTRRPLDPGEGRDGGLSRAERRHPEDEVAGRTPSPRPATASAVPGAARANLASPEEGSRARYAAFYDQAPAPATGRFMQDHRGCRAVRAGTCLPMVGARGAGDRAPWDPLVAAPVRRGLVDVSGGHAHGGPRVTPVRAGRTALAAIALRKPGQAVRGEPERAGRPRRRGTPLRGARRSGTRGCSPALRPLRITALKP